MFDSSKSYIPPRKTEFVMGPKKFLKYVGPHRLKTDQKLVHSYNEKTCLVDLITRNES